MAEGRTCDYWRGAIRKFLLSGAIDNGWTDGERARLREMAVR